MQLNTVDVVATTNDEYSTRDYWERRYATEQESFDWFKSYADIKAIFRELIPDQNATILILGCGNSTLADDLWEDGYRGSIVNVDYSETVIQKMKAKHNDKIEMEWLVMDVRKLSFDSETFDAVIDKGTMDAMMAVKGDVWNPPSQVVDDCTAEVSEVLRVLRKTTGVFVYLTFGQPHFRKRVPSIYNRSLANADPIIGVI